MKRFFSVPVVLSVAMSLCVQTANAAKIGDMAQIRSDIASVLDDPLFRDSLPLCLIW